MRHKLLRQHQVQCRYLNLSNSSFRPNVVFHMEDVLSMPQLQLCILTVVHADHHRGADRIVRDCWSLVHCPPKHHQGPLLSKMCRAGLDGFKMQSADVSMSHAERVDPADAQMRRLSISAHLSVTQRPEIAGKCFEQSHHTQDPPIQLALVHVLPSFIMCHYCCNATQGLQQPQAWLLCVVQHVI